MNVLYCNTNVVCNIIKSNSVSKPINAYLFNRQYRIIFIIIFSDNQIT